MMESNEQYIPEMSRASSKEYSAEHYRFLSTLIESESARRYYIEIVNTDFSQQCINAFHKILTSGFDKNAILARNENLKIRTIDFDISLNLMVSECHESDIMNPAFLTFRENIRQTFVDFVSRSKNAKERDQLLRQEYSSTVSEERRDTHPQGIMNLGQPPQQTQQRQQQQGGYR
jgi:hypothetical protein